ncbi:hypothetical protein [Bacillus sp. FJAT-42315]|uniref:hypothetical protein n=1 Tax=Bacillus sp. FJAT-42315 TaxID=2014077 RepID=UPI000C24E3F1|nr:hypothetical protein [Bacillus sp. FJAT-42315]
MKLLKIIFICLVSIMITFCTIKVSKIIIEDKNSHYVPENPFIMKDTQEDQLNPEDIDRMVSHSISGTKETTLPVKYDKNFTIYEDKLYVTNNKGKTWVQVPDDAQLGYARISEYLDTISQSNIYVSSEKITIVYGGRGSENISIITTDSPSEYWSVGSISKTATHDLQNGYDKMYIDFLDDARTGYLVAIRNNGTAQEKTLVYRSVNTGVTWDYVDMNDDIYREIMAQFGL